MIRRPPRSTLSSSSAASDVYKRQIFIIAVLALITLWFSLTLTKLINDAFTWSMSLGWISVALASVAGIALLMVGLHEIIGLARLHRIERLQIHAARAINQNDK